MTDSNFESSYDDAMRRAMHEVVDMLFDHVQNVASLPVVDFTPARQLRERFALIDEPSGPSAITGLLREYARASIQLHHPSYMGHQVCPPLPTAVIADLVISTINQSTAVWEMSPAGTVIEREVIRWLANRAGYPDDAAGTAVSGGSAANLTALLAARARWNREPENATKRPVVFCSADAHYSIARAAAIMGIPKEDVIEIGTDDRHRIDVDELESELASVSETGDRSTLALVATAGSTATGAFDALGDIAGLRDLHRTWLHVDAAHGASVLLAPSLAHLVNGLDRADSFAWDPHKMMWMPLSLGVILVRNGAWLRAAFQSDAPYLFHAERASQNLGEMTIQCSRRADAVKLWLTLRTLGVHAFTDALERVTESTRILYESIEADDDFQPMHEPQFNIFCFRWVGSKKRSDAELDAINQEIREEIMRGGEAWITSTVLKGKRVLRTTMINPATGRAEVERLVDLIRRIVKEKGW